MANGQECWITGSGYTEDESFWGGWRMNDGGFALLVIWLVFGSGLFLATGLKGLNLRQIL